MLRDKVRTANAVSVNEIYTSIQGEGLLVGTPSVFIRLQGCNLRCPWCDQKEALTFSNYGLPVVDIVNAVKRFPFRHAVITGGEPMAHQGVGELAKSLLEEGFSVQIETNGTLWVESLENIAENIHITCSPKAVARYFIHPKVGKYAKELKFVVDEELTEEILLRKEFVSFLRSRSVVLQPESNRGDMFKKALRIQEGLAKKGFYVRVIPQTHKFLGIR